MASLPYRLSPSGPVIAGAGFQLRFAENDEGMTPTPVLTTNTPLLALDASPEPLFASLANPSPDFLYGVDLSVNVYNDETDHEEDLTTILSFSYDGGTTWNDDPEVVTRDITWNSDAQGYQTILHQKKAVLGSALPGGGVPIGAPSLMVRVYAVSSGTRITVAESGDGQSYFLRLTEYDS